MAAQADSEGISTLANLGLACRRVQAMERNWWTHVFSPLWVLSVIRLRITVSTIGVW